MVLFRSLFAAFVLLSSPVAITATDSSPLVTNVQAPFYLRQDESGMLVAVVVHGPAPENQTPVFCSDSRTAFTGPNAMHCLRTSVENDTYELQLPFSFERDPAGTIVGVNFLEGAGNTIVIPFRTTVDTNGRLHAVVEPTVAEEEEEPSTLSIPYLIQRDEEGGVVAIVLDEDDEEHSIPLVYRTNEDGSVSIVFSGGFEKRKPRSLQLAILLGCLCGAALAGIAWKTWLYRCHRGETESGDTIEKSTFPPVPVV